MPIQSPIPLRWSAMKWRFREWKVDRKLKTDAGKREFRNSLREASRKLCVTSLLRQTWQLEGDVLECGVFRGQSLLQIASTIADAKSNKKLYGLDSFEGFPVGSVQKIDVPVGRFQSRVQTKFQHVRHVPDRIMRLCDQFGFQNVELVPGYFEETLSQLEGRKFCFVHLDVDLYSSYQTCLSALYDSVVPGGYIVFDEYEERYWPGATNAINEFFEDKIEKPEFAGSQYDRPKYFVQKQAAVARSKAA